jgi:hypothetical protein
MVQMDYPVVQTMEAGFRQQSEIILGIGKAAVMLFTGLEMSAFMCPPLAQYYGRCKDATDKKSKELSDKLIEFADDLKTAVELHKAGDTSGAGKF